MQEDVQKIIEEIKLLNEKTSILNRQQAKNKAAVIALKVRVAELEKSNVPNKP